MSKVKTLEDLNKEYPNWSENRKAWPGLKTMIDLELEAIFHKISIEEYLASREEERKAKIVEQINDLKRQL